MDRTSTPHGHIHTYIHKYTRVYSPNVKISINYSTNRAVLVCVSFDRSGVYTRYRNQNFRFGGNALPRNEATKNIGRTIWCTET